MSADFGRHPVGYFLAPLLARHDRDRLAVVCYSGVMQEDDLTQRFRSQASGWRKIAGMSEAALAEQVRADGIDILIDLAGHTAGNRLRAFARRPAPVQATWLGYWFTTGLAAIDYALMDETTVPPGEERHFVETVIRLPSRFCYAPPAHAPEVGPPPLLARGAPTFGSFNNLAKLTPEVAALWARVLHAVPGARLVLKWATLADPGRRRRIEEMFGSHAIAPERLDLRPRSEHAAMLAEYADIDVALDPFPFTGGLTSCEALWMGVPVVTLPGERPVSRQTLGFLDLVGLSDMLAARDADSYVAIAAGLVADPERLAALRAGLRARMAASRLCDGPAFAREFEAALRGMWRTWCARAGR